MKIVIVIPTYNESENIGPLMDALNSEFPKKPNHDFNVLIVEGNSPDGTADIVREKQREYPWLKLLMEKEKAGLGAAYMYGFKHAMNKLGADVIVEMDADFQHDPKDVVRLIEKIDEGYDYVLGSRYAKGGEIPKDWGLRRKFLSFGGTWFSKVVLGIFNVNDFTGGFKASRVKGFVDQLDLDSILSKGFAYKLELLHKMHRLGARITEVPIKFGLRFKGDSKMESNNMMDSMKVVLTLRYRESKSFIKFCVVGFAGLFVDTGLFNLFRSTSLTSNMAALVSGLFGMMTTFMLNNFWSFSERKMQSVKKAIIGFVVYVVSSFVPIIARSYMVKYAVLWFGDTFWVSNIAFFIGILFGLIWNYTVYSRIIWKKK